MDNRRFRWRSSRSRRSFLAAFGAVAGSTVAGCIGETGGAAAGRSSGQPAGGPLSALVPHMLWSAETAGEVAASPALADGVLYCGSFDGNMYAFEERGRPSDDTPGGRYPMFKYDLANTNAPDDGGPMGDLVERWSYPTGGRLFSAPAVADGSVFFGSEDGLFYSVSTDTGEEDWRIDAGGMVGGGYPTVVDGTVYFASGSSKPDLLRRGSDEGGSVRAVRAADGHAVWTVEYPEGVQSPPVVADGRVYHGCQDGVFYALDAMSGDEYWRFAGADEKFCASKPALRDGLLYVGCQDGSVYALRADGGGLAWRFDGTGTGAVVVSSPVVADGKVYFGASDGRMYSVDAATGEEHWRADAGGAVASSPAYKDGVLYVGRQGKSGELLALDAATGDRVWGFETGSHVLSSPVVDEGHTIYVGSNDRNVYAVENRVAEQ